MAAGPPTALLTGGAGYIGSHTAVSLVEHGYEVVLLDNFTNSSPVVADRLEGISGRRPVLIEADIRDRGALANVFANHDIDAVVHFAGLKAVGESVERPLEYWDNNVGGTIALLEAMDAADVRTIVFSSSATVYGETERLPVAEDAPTGAVSNPYGRTKFVIEGLLEDVARSDPRWSVSLLRYFNPVGAHSSGRIGEDPSDVPNNLMPFITQVAVGRRDELTVFGDDWPTADGTPERDYIHVVDLAEGHVAALGRHLTEAGVHTYNLGTGAATSVLEMVTAFELATDVSIPYRIGERRDGDVAALYCDPSLAERELGWKAKRGIDAMCSDAWEWQSKNPKGYSPD